MKQTLFYLLVVAGALLFSRCDKEEDDDRFRILTGHTWLADSLLANGVDASGPDMPLEAFKGEAMFRADGTGTFGQFTGTWRFQMGRTEIVIQTDAHPIPIAAKIEELTEASFKITTIFPNMETGVSMDIRMTFKPK